MTLTVTGDDTGGAYSPIDSLVPAECGPLPHVHHREYEAFWVLEGELEICVGEHHFTVGPGSFVHLPKGILHSCQNPGPGSARFLTWMVPAGGESCYRVEHAHAPAAARREHRMKRTTTLILILILAVLTGAGSLGGALAQGEASPTPAAGVSFTFPDADQVPAGMVIISDGERTLDDVASGFGDPVGTILRFDEWGWEGNTIRAFHIAEEDAADSQELDGIYISVHQFGSPEFAAEALDYSMTEHLLDPAIEEVEGPEFGSVSRTFVGDMAYGTEITFYVQEGPLLIRLSASSPEGDPTTAATELMQAILESQPATPVAG